MKRIRGGRAYHVPKHEDQGNVDGWNLDDQWLEIIDRAELGGDKGDITDMKNQNEKKAVHGKGNKTVDVWKKTHQTQLTFSNYDEKHHQKSQRTEKSVLNCAWCM